MSTMTSVMSIPLRSHWIGGEEEITTLEAISGRPLFVGLPSFGCIGQATADILVATSQKEFPETTQRLAIFESDLTVPVVGVERAQNAKDAELVFGIELYSLGALASVLLIRSLPIHGQETTLANALVELFEKLAPSTVIALTGASVEDWDTRESKFGPFFHILSNSFSSNLQHDKISTWQSIVNSCNPIPYVPTNPHGEWIPTSPEEWESSFSSMNHGGEWRAAINFSDRVYPYGMPMGEQLIQSWLKQESEEESNMKTSFAVIGRFSSTNFQGGFEAVEFATRIWGVLLNKTPEDVLPTLAYPESWKKLADAATHARREYNLF